jgi:3-oxoacyl-[acyl-carrier protein] reductase
MEGLATLVTGSARGIGRAVADVLQARGARVHVVWRNDARDLESAFPGRVHRADLCDGAAADRVVGEVLRAEGRLDVVVHAVGEYLRGSLAELSPADLRTLLDSNLMSAVNMAHAARGALRERGGVLVFFGTAGLESLRARRETAAYAAAKTALLVYARSLALEEASHGVRVNVVSPGLVPHADASEDTRDPERIARVPLGRATTAEDVAGVVSWLCSSESALVTGQNVEVAGGWLL